MDANNISKLGTVLGVWAHPDDETWASAGIMMTALANGQRVAVVTATRGERGSVDPRRWPLETLGKIRQDEMAKALKVLGITEHYWLDYYDGDCENVDLNQACVSLQQIFDKVRPDTVLTFGPDGLTGHPDHTTVGKWARQVARTCGFQPTVYEVTESLEKYESVDKQSDKLLNIFFQTAKPRMLPEAEMNICFRLTPALIEAKLNAIRAHKSQYEKLINYLENGIISKQITTPECFFEAALRD